MRFWLRALRRVERGGMLMCWWMLLRSSLLACRAMVTFQKLDRMAIEERQLFGGL